MSSMLCIALACCHRDDSRSMIEAAEDCHDVAEQASSLCSQACGFGDSMIVSSRDVKSDLESFGDGNGMDPRIFIKIKDLIKKDQAKAAVKFALEMEERASAILSKAEDMETSLSRSIEGLPNHVKMNAESETGTPQDDDHHKYRSMGDDTENTDTEGDEDIIKLLDVEGDIADLENSCSRSRGKLNLFSAPTMGTKIFETTASKGERCRDLFSQMNELCMTVTHLTSSIMHGNCCVQLQAIASGVGSLFKCRRLVNILAKAARSVLRLIKAICDLIKSVRQMVEGFMDEFTAAKKIGNFVKGAKKVGKKASGFGKRLHSVATGKMH